MPKLLRLDFSPRGAYSVSHNLADTFVTEWKNKNSGEVIQRDLSKGLPIVDLPWIAGAYSTPDQVTAENKAALKMSDELIDEIMSVDEILFATPFWNFTMPAQLTGYFDQIVRIGRTFTASYEGLLKGRKAYAIVSSGGNYAPGGYMEKMNQFDGPFNTVLGFIGIPPVIYHAYDTGDVSQGKVKLEDYLAEHSPKMVSTLLA